LDRKFQRRPLLKNSGGDVVMVTRMVRCLGTNLVGIIEVTFPELLERRRFEG